MGRLGGGSLVIDFSADSLLAFSFLHTQYESMNMT
jgi:hypothetical protein